MRAVFRSNVPKASLDGVTGASSDITCLALPLAKESSERGVEPRERRGRRLYNACLDAMQLACAQRRSMGKVLCGDAEEHASNANELHLMKVADCGHGVK